MQIFVERKKAKKCKKISVSRGKLLLSGISGFQSLPGSKNSGEEKNYPNAPENKLFK